MPQPDHKRLRSYELRAKLPTYLRYVVVAALAAAILVVVVGFYRAHSRSPFRLKGEHAQLSTDVIAEVSNYERKEVDNGVARYYIKAAYAKTFSDQHQELEGVYLEVYDDQGRTDKMASDAAIYIPEQDKNFTAYLNGNVKIETKDALKVATDQLAYTKANQIAESDGPVQFERDNVRGKATGAKVMMGEDRIDLVKDAEIETFESPELLRSGVRYAKINSASATFDQRANNMTFNGNVAINIASKSRSTGSPQTTNVNADRATASFRGEAAKIAQIDKVELFDNVHIVSAEQGGSPTNIDAGYALFNKDADSYELKNSAHIVTAAGDKPTDIRANSALYERAAFRITLSGSAEVTQMGNYLKGDDLTANLFPDNRIKDAVVRGNALARQTAPERTSTITAPELNAAFAESRDLKTANAVGQSSVELVPADDHQYSRVTTVAERGIGLIYKAAGSIDQMNTDGRTTIVLNAPEGVPDAANKKVTADKVTTYFAANGKDIRKAEAVGDAELYVEPLTAGVKNYKTTINAPRFDCDFFATGNNVRVCQAGKKVKAVRVPTAPDDKHGTQTMTADEMTASFAQATHDVEKLDADGSAKFNELDRTAIAHQMTFTDADGVLRLRGGEPTAWDSRARVKAREIDWDTRSAHSYYRGAVSTTYYSSGKMGNSAPFGSEQSPVYMTADAAEMDHNAKTAVYTGNARGWQDDNYVRADKLILDEVHGTFNAEGRVQSALYSARTAQKGRSSAGPTYASAAAMSYGRDQRILRYRSNVDIRQGTDRITAGSADVYLDEKNDMTRTVAENNVVVTQPGRRASGDWAQYTAEDEMAILRGDPATVSDAENGSSQSGQITFSMRDRKVVSEAKTKQNPNGRTRSVYKVKPN